MRLNTSLVFASVVFLISCTGEQGPEGTAGAPGEKGAQGFPGPQGVPGPTGPPGPAGATGAVGATGVTGPQGLPGLTGQDGLAGAMGAMGLAGLDGAAGATGATGATGETGPLPIIATDGGLLGTGAASAPLQLDLPAVDQRYIRNQTAAPQTASYNISGTGTVGGNASVGGALAVTSTATADQLLTGAAAIPAGVINSLVLQYPAAGGPLSPGVKWSDGTFANTGALSLDGNGPNGLSWQGPALYPCLMVRAVTSNNTSGTVMARMCADGSIVGSVKNFEEPHPTRPDKRILYASLEGPEAAMYLRGSAAVGRDPVTVELPEHFSVLVAGETLTVSLTPIGRCPGGLYVQERSGTRLTVARENPEAAACTFDYLVIGTRAKYRDYQVVRDLED